LHRAKDELRRHRQDADTIARLLGEKAELLDKLRAMNEVRPISTVLRGHGSHHAKHAERLATDLSLAGKQNDALERDRHDLVSGISELRDDLHRVRSDAAELGRDLGAVKRSAVASTSNGSSGSDEAKSLLTMIRYLKAKCTREAGLRADLAHQKEYLQLLLREKDARCARVCVVSSSTLTMAQHRRDPSDALTLWPDAALRVVGSSNPAQVCRSCRHGHRTYAPRRRAVAADDGQQSGAARGLGKNARSTLDAMIDSRPMLFRIFTLVITTASLTWSSCSCRGRSPLVHAPVRPHASPMRSTWRLIAVTIRSALSSA
jgi:hypothetical protein